ncbi:hypothetical protein PQR02_11825 [Paraburkholderia sediminicola]|uniref:Uncharacterized protein n=1 Tax=Paraburkholderia rhynchosiae TaxID=487049 RepID=A0ACC7N6V8_9BURK
MTTLILKDLSRFDELDHAASQSVRGGIAYITRGDPGGYNGGIVPPVFGHPGWGGYPPVHVGCGPVLKPYGHPPVYPVGVITPL